MPLFGKAATPAPAYPAPEPTSPASPEGPRRRLRSKHSLSSASRPALEDEEHGKARSSKLKVLAYWLIASMPQLVIAGSLAGSAVVTKLSVLAGLLPGTLTDEWAKAYEDFAKLPLLQAVLGPLGFGSRELMAALAGAHLLAAALLVLPSGKAPALLAGLWAMVLGAGAEYCTRETKFVFPGTPKEFVDIAGVVGSVTHVMICFFGLILVCARRCKSLGLVAWMLACGDDAAKASPAAGAGTASAATGAAASAVGTSPAPAAPAAPAAASSASASAPAVGSSKRSSTPGAIAAGKKST